MLFSSQDACVDLGLPRRLTGRLFFSPHWKKSTCFCVQAAVEYLGVFCESGLITHVPNGTSVLSWGNFIDSELRYFGGTMFGDFMRLVHAV